MLNQEQFKMLGDWAIEVLQMGSSILPWIDNPHDIDYQLYVKDVKDKKKLALLYSFKTDGGECWFTIQKRGCDYYSYQYYYAKTLLGEETERYNIFDHVEEYKKVLIQRGLNNQYKRAKVWYHILTGIYLLENGKYELTEEQIANVQLCHDRKMTDDIYNYIQKKLAEFSKKC